MRVDGVAEKLDIALELVLTVDLPAGESELVLADVVDVLLLNDDLRAGHGVVSIGVTLVGAKVDVVHTNNGEVTVVLDAGSEFSIEGGVWSIDGAFEVA